MGGAEFNEILIQMNQSQRLGVCVLGYKSTHRARGNDMESSLTP